MVTSTNSWPTNFFMISNISIVFFVTRLFVATGYVAVSWLIESLYYILEEKLWPN